MSVKIPQSTYPANCSAEDFECFGPVAVKDTEFSGCRMADFGCFKQDEGVDSNKAYHAAVIKHKKTGNWYLYTEWGRTTGGRLTSFQFLECASEAEAMKEFEKQCASKNTKRGVWEKVGSKERYVPRPKTNGKTDDLYVVRYMASRSVGLPAAHGICNGGALPTVKVSAQGVKTKAKRIDEPTAKLFRDLLGGTVKYTRQTIVGGTLPAQEAINDARELLDDALERLGKVGNKLEKQIADPTLKKLTYNLYGIIPKTKALGATEDQWILSQANIGAWQSDLDAFESALKSAHVEEVEEESDVMQGIPADVEYIPLTSELGKWIVEWWKSTMGDNHGHMRRMQIHNLWRIDRHGDQKVFDENLKKTVKEMPANWNETRPRYIEQQKQRPDLSVAARKDYWMGNSALLFHGTRAVNTAGIIRENFRFPSELRKTGNVIINNAMFGGGTYTADCWTKSAGYCSKPDSHYVRDGGIPGRHAFMFACDTILGNPYVAPGAKGFTEPPAGHHCVHGKAGFTQGWGGALVNNEWIVYRKGRIVLRYLAELSW